MIASSGSPGERAATQPAATQPPLAAIFDLDGLLIDTEPLWHEAEVTVLGPLGVPLERQDTRQTKGMFVGEVVRFWHERHPWDDPSPEVVVDAVLAEVQRLVHARAQRRPGVDRVLAACRDRGLHLAVASSSPVPYITAALDQVGLGEVFPVVRSAESEPYGKPHPGVFLSAAAALGVAPDRCVVWEDAPAGVLAAKAARMRCVAVPDPEDQDRPEVALADVVLSSLEGMDDTRWGILGMADEQMADEQMAAEQMADEQPATSDATSGSALPPAPARRTERSADRAPTQVI